MNDQRFSMPHTCPRWLLFAFDNPVRTAIQRPRKILERVIQPADIVLDVGCGTGYLSFPAAEIVGEQGKIIAADLQEDMLCGLKEKAAKKGLTNRIQTLQTTEDHIGVTEPVDVTLAFWMAHEVRDQEGFFKEIYDVLKPGGKFLLVEPRIHVLVRDFKISVNLAEQIGFKTIARPFVAISQAVILQK